MVVEEKCVTTVEEKHVVAVAEEKHVAIEEEKCVPIGKKPYRLGWRERERLRVSLSLTTIGSFDPLVISFSNTKS